MHSQLPAANPCPPAPSLLPLQTMWLGPPLVVMNNFGGEEHMRLAAVTFQNLFPAINVQATKLSACQVRGAARALGVARCACLADVLLLATKLSACQVGSLYALWALLFCTAPA